MNRELLQLLPVYLSNHLGLVATSLLAGLALSLPLGLAASAPPGPRCT